MATISHFGLQNYKQLSKSPNLIINKVFEIAHFLHNITSVNINYNAFGLTLSQKVRNDLINQLQIIAVFLYFKFNFNVTLTLNSLG